MTDTYGSDPHDHELGHDEVSTQDSDVVHEPPSDYEFSDEQGTGSEQDESLSPQSGGKPASRSALLPIVAALGGVLLLGTVAWWQFGGGSSSLPSVVTSAAPGGLPLPAMPPVVATPEKSSDAPSPLDAAISAAQVAPKTASVSQKGPENNGLAVASSSNAMPTSPDGALQQAKPVATTVPNVPAAPVVAAPVVAAPVVSAAPVSAVVPLAPAAAAIPAAQPSAPVVPNASATAVVPAPVSSSAPAPASDVSDHRIEMLTARVDSLQKALDQANQQLGQMTNVIGASSGIGAAAAPSKDLQDRLDKLEQEITTINSRPAPAATRPVPAHAVPSVTSNEPEAISVPAVHVATTVSAPHHKVAHKASHKQAKKAASEAKKSNKLVLRAASPGQAWVASGSSSTELKEVHVGDKLPGVGRIKSIEMQGDNWVVSGTKGSLK